MTIKTYECRLSARIQNADHYGIKLRSGACLSLRYNTIRTKETHSLATVCRPAPQRWARGDVTQSFSLRSKLWRPPLRQGAGKAHSTALCALHPNISCFGHKKTPYALRAWAWGGRGRRFKSGHSDQYVKTAFRYCGEPLFSCQNILTQKKLRRQIGAFGFILHLRKLCKFCFQCRIDLCVKLVVFLILRYSLCFRLLYLVGLYYCLTSFRY